MSAVRNVFIIGALTVAVLAILPAAGASGAGSDRVKVKVLSNRADLISGGDALLEIKLPAVARASKVRVTLRRRLRGRVRVLRVSSRFAERGNGRYMGLVRGLKNGRNVVAAAVPGAKRGRAILTNHPNGGPVFSGPQIKPWVCQETARDRKCNQPPEYELLYRSTDPSKALQTYDPENPPSDVATTTTDEGITVPFIVRVETPYQDRDEYKIATLFQPGKRWKPWAPQEQWNRKLLITHGGSCGADFGAWHAPSVFYDGSAGDATGVPPIDNQYARSPTVALGRGFAVMSTALNNNGHNCNIVTQAESLVMAKERLVERYGPIRYTIGTGCSGGSLTQQQVANAYPGIYQGILPQCSFPDTWTSATQVADYHVLRAYFEDPSRWGPGIVWTPTQMAAVEGHPTHLNAITSDQGFFNAARAEGSCWPLPPEQRYDSESNPDGVRCGIADYTINVFGPRPEDVWGPQEQKVGHGFAGIALDNTGVEYGLGALRQRLITPAQFVDLNTELGGLDIDAELSDERLSGDRRALRNAYRSGAINEANNLDQVAIIDLRGPDPGAAHDAYRTWTIRSRLEREQGHFRNHVIWFGQFPVFGDVNYPTEALVAMDRWLSAVERDRRDMPLAQKIIDDKPADIRDRCSQLPGGDLFGETCQLLPDAQTRYGTPRTVAGDAIATDVNKCRRTPLGRAGHGPLPFADTQWARLEALFPTGVCDFTQPGVGQRDTILWLRYQERDGDVVYGGHRLRRAPAGSGSGWTSRVFGSWRRPSAVE